jgi:hypothetical protein
MISRPAAVGSIATSKCRSPCRVSTESTAANWREVAPLRYTTTPAGSRTVTARIESMRSPRVSVVGSTGCDASTAFTVRAMTPSVGMTYP